MIGNITLDLIDSAGRGMRLPLAVNPSDNAIINPYDGEYMGDDVPAPDPDPDPDGGANRYEHFFFVGDDLMGMSASFGTAKAAVLSAALPQVEIKRQKEYDSTVNWNYSYEIVATGNMFFRDKWGNEGPFGELSHTDLLKNIDERDRRPVVIYSEVRWRLAGYYEVAVFSIKVMAEYEVVYRVREGDAPTTVLKQFMVSSQNILEGAKPI